MNKLMLVTSAVIMSASCLLGGECGETVQTATCPYGYRLKVMVRTTNPCNVIEGCGCGDTVTYRNPAIRRYIGVVYGQTAQILEVVPNGQCGETVAGCGCNGWGNAKIALWNYETKKPVALDADSTELIQLNRVGCVSDGSTIKAEMAFKLGQKNDTEMTFAGFGLCGKHSDQMTLGTVAGYCAGTLPAGMKYDSACAENVVETTKIWSMCTPSVASDCATTAAYGKWTLTWDNDVASKVGVNLTDTTAVTAWGTATPCVLADAR